MINKNTHIGIIGAGTMGTGIAQVCAAAGYIVYLFDIDKSKLSSSISTIRETLMKNSEKLKINSNAVENIFSSILLVSNLSELQDCSFIIEAAAEDLQIKRNLFKELSAVVSKESILATNTSSLSITSIASVCSGPERIIGTHFFNPALLMKLVEIIPGLLTSEEIKRKTIDLITSLNKTTVVAKDTPGFIVNRAARPFYGEALRILEEGIADHVTIDWAMKELGGFRMGPFELMDLIGNDINYKVSETVFSELYYDPRYKPSLIQKRMVEAGLLGRKTGKGFYSYTGKNQEPCRDHQKGEEIFERILFMLINEAADIVQFNIASEEDLETAVRNGLNYPKGILQWAYDYGVENVLDGINRLYSEYNEDRYRPSAYLKKMCIKEQKGIS